MNSKADFKKYYPKVIKFYTSRDGANFSRSKTVRKFEKVLTEKKIREMCRAFDSGRPSPFDGVSKPCAKERIRVLKIFRDNLLKNPRIMPAQMQKILGNEMEILVVKYYLRRMKEKLESQNKLPRPAPTPATPIPRAPATPSPRAPATPSPRAPATPSPRAPESEPGETINDDSEDDTGNEGMIPSPVPIADNNNDDPEVCQFESLIQVNHVDLLTSTSENNELDDFDAILANDVVEIEDMEPVDLDLQGCKEESCLGESTYSNSQLNLEAGGLGDENLSRPEGTGNVPVIKCVASVSISVDDEDELPEQIKALFYPKEKPPAPLRPKKKKNKWKGWAMRLMQRDPQRYAELRIRSEAKRQEREKARRVAMGLPPVPEKPRRIGSGSNSNKTSSTTRPGAIYKCPTCPSLEPMDVHFFVAHLIFHGNRPNKCTECQWYLPANEELIERHWTDYHSALDSQSKWVPAQLGPFKVCKCGNPMCDQLFETAAEREGHEMLVHGTVYVPDDIATCSVCSSQFRNVAEARIHKALEHPKEASLDCFFCDQTFETRSYEGVPFRNLAHVRKHILEKHTDRYLTKTDNPVVDHLQDCSVCGLIFCKKTDINEVATQHMEREHGVHRNKCFTCPICLRETSLRWGWMHLRNQHWPDAPKDYLCQFCGKGFVIRKSKDAHEAIHKALAGGERPFTCELCGRSFPLRGYLQMHKKNFHEKYHTRRLKEKQTEEDKVSKRAVGAGRIGNPRKRIGKIENT